MVDRVTQARLRSASNKLPPRFFEGDTQPQESRRDQESLTYANEDHETSDNLFSEREPQERDSSVADDFDEAGYLRLNPDVREAIERGYVSSGYQHYHLYGKTESRAVPQAGRDGESVFSYQSHPAEKDARARGIRCSVEELVVAPAAGLMIAGWIDDRPEPLSLIRITGADWQEDLDASRVVRVRRVDVENVQGARAHAFGFIGFLHFEHAGRGDLPLRIELYTTGGACLALNCGPDVTDGAKLRDRVLAAIASASFFGSPSIESTKFLSAGLGMELVRLNNSITQNIVAAPYVERFASSARKVRGSIMVCLYGKPEFFFIQNCLFGGLAGIEDYEFVYVSNSPEMAETLLREARCASRIYGLPTSVVILPGNAGFGAANNVGAQCARSDRLLAVNPDVFPRDRDWARKHTDLLAAVPEEQSRLFGAPLYYDDGSLMHGGMYFEIEVGLSMCGGSASPVQICRTQHYGKGTPAQLTLFNRPRPVPAVTGAFMSIERAWFEQLGGFSEDYIFGHYEDADLCLKSLINGTAPWLHDIRLWHLEGKGSTRDPPHEGGSMVNRWHFSTSWLPTIEAGLSGPSPSHPMMRDPTPVVPGGSDSRTKRRMNRQKSNVG